MNRQQVRRAGAAVRGRISELHATQAEIADIAGVGLRTLQRLIAGEQFPSDRVQRRLEVALRWRDGELAARAVHPGSLDTCSDLDLVTELHRRIADR